MKRAAVPPSTLPQPKATVAGGQGSGHGTVAAPAPLAAARRPVPAVSSDDDIYDRAVSIVRRERTADPVILERRLGIGYVMAMLLLEQMARDRIVSDADDDGHRRVLIGRAA